MSIAWALSAPGAVAIGAPAVVALSARATAAPGGPTTALRVCADPNNLPYSNRAGAGFENAIAHLVANDLHRPLAFTWRPQRRGFLREGLNAGQCDVVMGLPAESDMVRTTRPYYRSTYVFVTRASDTPVSSFDDPVLTRRTVGVQIIGDDYDNAPTAEALARRGLVDHVRGFPVYGDYSRPIPMRPIVDAVTSHAVDLAVVWGPLAGYVASLDRSRSLVLTPVRAAPRDAPLQFSFAIAMGVRKSDVTLARELDDVIGRRRADIERILRRYRVPLLPLDSRGGRT